MPSGPATAPASDSTGAAIEPRRVRNFAEFFKRYMSLSSVVTASLPIPFTAFQLIPTYAGQTRFLSTYTSLFCFLLLAFVFYSRHTIARGMFNKPSLRGKINPKRWVALLPLAMILLSLALVFTYHALLDQSVRSAQAIHLARGVPIHSMEKILAATDSLEIPYAVWLIAVHMAMFLTAEAAFILMALREYLQDLLQLSEMQLIGYPES